ncbi:MAG: hypothetical protein QM750_19880 [Rubrivivax sp.]
MNTLHEAHPGQLTASAHAAGSEQQTLWEYFLDNIDEFAVAKAIVDHFDAQPANLTKTQLVDQDMIAIYLRAKVSIKRQQIAFAEAQSALQHARNSSKGLRGLAMRASRLTGFVRGLTTGENGRLLAVFGVMAGLYLSTVMH